MLAPAPSSGQTPPIRNQRSATGNQRRLKDVVVLRREGSEARYNMDYATARAIPEEIKRAPHHPAGDLYVATVIWLEHLNKSRRLQTSRYKNESSFYAGADKAKIGTTRGRG